MRDPKHVYFCYIGSKLDSETVASLMLTREYLKDKLGFSLPTNCAQNARGPYIPSNRTKLFADVENENGHTKVFSGLGPEAERCGVVFMFDWDMGWTVDDWLKLYHATVADKIVYRDYRGQEHEHRGLGIFSGQYIRGHGYDNIHMQEVEGGSWTVDNEPFWDNGLHKVKTVGNGFLMCRTEVFDQFPWPWFNREVPKEFTEPGRRQQYGEDVAFCLNALDAGVPSFVQGGLFLNHYKTVRINALDRHREIEADKADLLRRVEAEEMDKVLRRTVTALPPEPEAVKVNGAGAVTKPAKKEKAQ